MRNEVSGVYEITNIGIQFTSCSRCGSKTTEHPQTHISYGDQSACVDEKLARLILALWRLGVRTYHSCQWFELTNGYMVILAFPTKEDMRRFRKYVGSIPIVDWFVSKESVQQIMDTEPDMDTSVTPADEWVIAFSPDALKTVTKKAMRNANDNRNRTKSSYG